MKEFKKLLSMLLAFALSFTVLAGMTVTAGAADYTSAKTIEANKAVSISNDKSASASAYFKLVLPDTGKIRFYASSGKTSAKTTFEFINSKGKVLLSGRYSELIAKTRHFNQKGTYYLKLTVLKGQSISKLYYTFIADSGKKVNKSITAEEGKSYDLSAYVKGFGGSVKWSTSDSTVAGISTKGVLTASKSGTAKIYAFSSKGDYAVIDTAVSAKKGAEWLTNYTLTDSDYEEIERVLGHILGWNKAEYKENELSESKAIDLLIAPKSPTFLLAPGYEDVRGEWLDPKDWVNKEFCYRLKADIVDDTLYKLFGIKAIHKVSGIHFAYKDGYYYYPDPAAGGGGSFTVESSEAMSDGKYLIKYRCDKRGSDGSIFDTMTRYVLISVHNDNGSKFIRFHAICQSRADALAGY